MCIVTVKLAQGCDDCDAPPPEGKKLRGLRRAKALDLESKISSDKHHATRVNQAQRCGFNIGPRQDRGGWEARGQGSRKDENQVQL